jgi:hypothetical protein
MNPSKVLEYYRIRMNARRILFLKMVSFFWEIPFLVGTLLGLLIIFYSLMRPYLCFVDIREDKAVENGNMEQDKERDTVYECRKTPTSILPPLHSEHDHSDGRRQYGNARAYLDTISGGRKYEIRPEQRHRTSSSFLDRPPTSRKICLLPRLSRVPKAARRPFLANRDTYRRTVTAMVKRVPLGVILVQHIRKRIQYRNPLNKE